MAASNKVNTLLTGKGKCAVKRAPRPPDTEGLLGDCGKKLPSIESELRNYYAAANDELMRDPTNNLPVL
jgi:hypothetical protein